MAFCIIRGETKRTQMCLQIKQPSSKVSRSQWEQHDRELEEYHLEHDCDIRENKVKNNSPRAIRKDEDSGDMPELVYPYPHQAILISSKFI